MSSTHKDEAAKFIKEKLRKILKQNSTMVSVKVDAASRFSRSFLGINVQVIYEQKVQLFVLGLEEINLRHTGENFKQMIQDCLAKYEILSSQIYSITSDNGSNMLKAIELIDAEYRKLRYNNIDAINVNDEEEINELVKLLCGNDWTDEEILAISCALHSLQLAIQDALRHTWSDDNEDFQTYDSYVQHIKAGRALVLKLRKQNNLILLREKNINKPSLDVKTRWGSTFSMISDLLKTKEVCAEAVSRGHFEFFLPEGTWSALKEIHDSLLPSYIATKKLQSKQLTLPDARKIINVCWLRTAEIGTPLSQELVNRFEQRRKQILDSEGMLNAVFMDPRQLFDLSAVERACVRKRLIALHIKLQNMKRNVCPEGTDEEVTRNCELADDIPVTSEGLESMDDSDDNIFFERVLQKKYNEAKRRKLCHPTLTSVSQFEEELADYERKYVDARIPSSSSLLKLWEDNSLKYPTLYPIALIVLAAAGTQVSVERLFSAMKFILNDQRSTLSSDNTQNILLVRGNFAHLDDTFFLKILNRKK